MKRNLIKKLSCIGLLLLLCCMKQYAQTVYTVIYAGDVANAQSSPAPGLLRWAINKANANPGESIINFNIPGTGPITITLNITLPPISKTVTIDGTTQPGYDFTHPENPMIIVTGSTVLATGLVFNSCQRAKVSGIYLKKFDIGLALQFCNYCEIINNVITGSTDKSLHLISSNFNTIKGNYINVDQTLVALPVVSTEGLFIQSSNDNIIGGRNCGEGNTIAYVYSEGIDNYSTPGQRNLYAGNRIFENDIGYTPRYEILLRVSGNGGIAFPTIVSTGCDVSGTSQANNTIELFGSSGPTASSLNAKLYMGSTKADAKGQWSMPVSNITYPFITATATDSVNNTSELSVVSAIALDPLDLTIKRPTSVCTQQKTTFEITGGKCLKALVFSWDFGDGSAASSSAEHTYTAPGTYTVKVSAYQKNNCQPLTASLAVPVTACSAFDCSACSFSLGGTGLTFVSTPGLVASVDGYLTATVTVSGGNGPFTYSWTCSSNATLRPGMSQTTIMLTGLANLTDKYTATVKVTDAIGCVSYKTFYYN
jgi:parallel beta-helix repeat protein